MLDVDETLLDKRHDGEDTRANMERLGFPMGGNADTFLMQGERPEWGSAKSVRRAFIAKDYRVLPNIGDNFGDFDDRYRSSEAERIKAFEADKGYWGKQWLMLANPTYGSFESATFGHDFKKPAADQRKAKWAVIEGWSGPKQLGARHSSGASSSDHDAPLEWRAPSGV